MSDQTIKVVPEGTSALDVMLGDAQAVDVISTEGRFTIPGAVVPPGTPPAGDQPPAGDAPPPPVVGAPLEGVITDEVAMRHLFGDNAPFKTKEELTASLQGAQKTNEAIRPFTQVLDLVKQQALDPEIVEIANFKKVTGLTNPSIRSLVNKANDPNASALDVLVANTILSIPGRADRIEDTRNELAQQYGIADGVPLPLSAETAVQDARKNITEVIGKVSALPVSGVDVDAQLQQAKQKYSDTKAQWVSALETGVGNIITSHKEVKLFEGFSTPVDLSAMKAFVPEMAEIAAATDVELNNEGAAKLLGNAYNAAIVGNISAICEAYYLKRKKEDDAASDKPAVIGRQPDTPPGGTESEYEKTRREMMG